jgi:hypothetical protein
MTGAAFYCVSSDLFFPGAVALVNSLRRAGHTETIHLLDCGLTPAHRELLEAEVAVLDAEAEAPPHLLKTSAPLAHPAETMVLIDVDMVVTRSLAPLVERAAAGAVVAFKDNIDRHVTEWGELLDLGTLERRPYVSSGLVVLGGERGAEVLRLWADRLPRVDYERSWFADDSPDYPFRFMDQDVLNAVLCARTGEGELVVEEPRLAPHQPYRGLHLDDEVKLRCSYPDGTRPYVLHQYLEKPWVRPMYHGIYSKLLSRLWLSDDLPVRLPVEEVPRRMRHGALARIERRLVDAADLVRWYARDVIPERLGARSDPEAR